LVSSRESKVYSGELDLDIEVASDEDEYCDEEKTLFVRRWTDLLLSRSKELRLDPVELFLRGRAVDESSDCRLSIDDVVGDDEDEVLSVRLMEKTMGFQERRIG
jgi:hypothetical protein